MPWVVVFDTNILLSALLSLRGNPFRCLALVKTGIVDSVTCEEILDEFEEKLRDKFAFSSQQAHAASDELRRFSRLVTITGTLKIVTADPDDDKVLECAVIGGASYIVTGDRRHLLPLGTYQNISIVSPADLLTLVSFPRGTPGSEAQA